jgi:hypothetical protein
MWGNVCSYLIILCVRVPRMNKMKRVCPTNLRDAVSYQKKKNDHIAQRLSLAVGLPFEVLTARGPDGTTQGFLRPGLPSPGPSTSELPLRDCLQPSQQMRRFAPYSTG